MQQVGKLRDAQALANLQRLSTACRVVFTSLLLAPPYTTYRVLCPQLQCSVCHRSMMHTTLIVASSSAAALAVIYHAVTRHRTRHHEESLCQLLQTLQCDVDMYAFDPD